MQTSERKDKDLIWMITKRKKYSTKGFRNCVKSTEKPMALIVLSAGTMRLVWSQIRVMQLSAAVLPVKSQEEALYGNKEGYIKRYYIAT